MRTREGTKNPNKSSGKDNRKKGARNLGSGSGSGSHSNNDSGTLSNMSHKGVDKLLRRVNARGLSGTKNQPESELKINDKQVADARVTWNDLDADGCDTEAKEKLSGDSRDEMDDSDWEDGSAPRLDSLDNQQDQDHHDKGVSIEFSVSPDSASRKPVRRATAEDKELAELVHKAHLLCLLARGRLIDSACDDPLFQASLLSLLPIHLLETSSVSKLTANALYPLVSWFHNNFQVKSSGSAKSSFHSALAHALESHEGTLEELAALSVALFRALKLTTRFVSVLDVASLKPDAETCEPLSHDASGVGRGIFSNPTLMVTRQRQASVSPSKSYMHNEKDNLCDTSIRSSSKNKENYTTRTNTSKDSPILDHEAQNDIPDPCLVPGSKRKGDLEFQMQLEMALSATKVGTCGSNSSTDMTDWRSNSSEGCSPRKRIKNIHESSTSSQGISTAVGSKKVGSPLYWAEVYCSGENLTGKWVHVDAINGIIDGEQKVEAAVAACKTSLRYAVAFAGRGAKDVTRRYCMKWHKIASKRVNSTWWDAVLAPLRELESAGNGGLEASKENGRAINAESSTSNSIATRNALEDMELETRALTEPLPTNQQAYKNHELYALERWLTKYQILYPKGPVLGFCSGHAVYPRTCVQTLKPKHRWLREGLQVKANELPVKVLKRPSKLKKQVFESEDYDEDDAKGTIELYGKWQLEPLCLPHAVNGIVPKNERGQVDVWSEKCLPPGTVHIRLPRIFLVAKRLQIDYAPAMVGFEFRNGRSIPVFDGIVVCAEFKDAIFEAYAEEAEIREAEEKKRNEAQAVSRWYQLLSSIVTRQRLNNSYGDGLSSGMSNNIQITNDKLDAKVSSSKDDRQLPQCQQGDIKDTKLEIPPMTQTEDHEHIFLKQDESYDEESSIRTKRCHCGFSIQVEEL